MELKRSEIDLVEFFHDSDHQSIAIQVNGGQIAFPLAACVIVESECILTKNEK